MVGVNPIQHLNSLEDTGNRMPALFVGHGSPLNAIEDNEYAQAWREMGKALPPPKAILCVSAHWETDGTRVTAMPTPKTIHDFYGFPQPLFDVRYPAPGAPAVAESLSRLDTSPSIGLDHEWGLDHGAWSVLCRMFPDADVPVAQLSLNRGMSPQDHYALAKQLAPLRRKGVLVIGSGNIVHNLRRVVWSDEAYDWAVEFDERVAHAIKDERHDDLIHVPRLGDMASLAVPTHEHFLPLLYVLALQDHDDAVSFFAEGVTLGAISMRSVRIG